ncbi:helix-turn-helix domain-containing protein [Bacillus pseudomycoides]|uniref:helix-turn-helix domain-containing protein n=1 Tax=Bacillus pseudomycoides TaxID=64104 RepID=UPI000BF9D955|nr:helix-turn-helix domain-containing protein [Bacillus pseudomycoides]PGA71742.1 excisionase [Bacillus pseudomycoides]
MDRRTITAVEAAEYLGVSKDLIYNMVKVGQLPFIRIGRRILFRVETLECWMQNQEMQCQSDSSTANPDGPNLSVLLKQ